MNLTSRTTKSPALAPEDREVEGIRHWQTKVPVFTSPLTYLSLVG
jgi:hypothetical protein